MDIEQAHRINSAISSAFFAACGVNDEPFPDLSSLKDVSLSDMLEAARMIRDENETRENAAEQNGGGRIITAVADDRVIAAVFVLVNYEHSREPIVNGNRRLVAVLPASAIETAKPKRKPRSPDEKQAAD